MKETLELSTVDQKTEWRSNDGAVNEPGCALFVSHALDIGLARGVWSSFGPLGWHIVSQGILFRIAIYFCRIVRMVVAKPS